MYVVGLEASKRKQYTLQLFPARILGTTRKIFAKQFSVGLFALFLFGIVFSLMWWLGIFGGCILMIFGFCL